jgi:hypothetical protein
MLTKSVEATVSFVNVVVVPYWWTTSANSRANGASSQKIHLCFNKMAYRGRYFVVFRNIHPMRGRSFSRTMWPVRRP